MIITYSLTDILMYEIKAKDIYEDSSKDKELFDFLDYSVKSKYYGNSNKLLVDKMKDEMPLLKNLLD